MAIVGILRALCPASGTEDAAQRRNRAVAWSMASIYVVKLITVTASLVSVPLASSYLGLERYGLWLSISSFISLLLLSDFGLGNHLTTTLAQCLGRGDTEGASRQVSATVWAVLAACGLLVGAVAVAMPFISWPAVFNVHGTQAVAEAPRAALLMGLIAALQLFGTLCQRVYAGLQRNHVGTLWQGAGSLAGLIALVAVTRMQAGLPTLVFALGGVPALTQVVGLAWVLRTGAHGGLRSALRLDWADYRDVLGGGALMFVVNLQSVFWLAKDNLLIAHVSGLESVGAYNTAFRIFQSVFVMLVGSLGASLWPAYADAHGRGDRRWIRSCILRSVKTGMIGMLVFSIGFVPFGSRLLTWYAGAGLSLPLGPLALLAAYFIVLAGVNLLSYPLMGAGQVATIAWGGLLGGLATLPLALWIVPKHGLVGLVVVNLSCNFLFQFLPLIWKNHLLGNLSPS